MADDEDEVVIYNDEESNQAPSTYQMKPTLDEIFKGEKIRHLIQKIMQSTLQDKTYNTEEVKEWTIAIADNVNSVVRDLRMDRYRHVVQVTIGEQLGSGCRYIARCQWDAECDNFVSEVFSNATLFCICTVFGIYMY